MNVNHHPDDATLVSYAAGSLVEAFDILVACHLRYCGTCRRRVAQAEQIGSMLLEDEPEAVTPQQRMRFLARLEQEDSRATTSCAPMDPLVRSYSIAPALAALLNDTNQGLPWRRVLPGIKRIRLNDSSGGSLRLLSIAPGIAIPRHRHGGSEMTLVVRGAYRDTLGYFQQGDVADLGPETEHQPTSEGDAPCICLIATDAPLQFDGVLAKLLQPFAGF